jgi:hypothetical protein
MTLLLVVDADVSDERNGELRKAAEGRESGEVILPGCRGRASIHPSVHSIGSIINEFIHSGAAQAQLRAALESPASRGVQCATVESVKRSVVALVGVPSISIRMRLPHAPARRHTLLGPPSFQLIFQILPEATLHQLLPESRF